MTFTVREKAFTLVELLVVVAIIALLLGILVPALGKARQLAQIRVCEANVASIMKGIAFYMVEYQQTYPIGEAQDNDGGNHVLETVNLVGSKGIGNNPAGMAPPEARLLNPLLTSATLSEDTEIKVAECPLDKGDAGSSSAGTNTTYDWYGSSYVYLTRTVAEAQAKTNRGRAGMWAPAGHKESDFPQLSQKVIVGDFIILTNRSATNAKSHWHNDDIPLSVTAGFADTHVAQIERKEGTALGQPGWPSNYSNITDEQIDEMRRGDYY